MCINRPGSKAFFLCVSRLGKLGFVIKMTDLVDFGRIRTRRDSTCLEIRGDALDPKSPSNEPVPRREWPPKALGTEQMVFVRN